MTMMKPHDNLPLNVYAFRIYTYIDTAKTRENKCFSFATLIFVVRLFFFTRHLFHPATHRFIIAPFRFFLSTSPHLTFKFSPLARRSIITITFDILLCTHAPRLFHTFDTSAFKLVTLGKVWKSLNYRLPF